MGGALRILLFTFFVVLVTCSELPPFVGKLGVNGTCVLSYTMGKAYQYEFDVSHSIHG